MMTLFGVVASNAQYQDSSPPDEPNSSQYDTERAYDDDYDEELLGPRDDERYNDRGYDDRGYNEPDLDVGIFASLGHDGRWSFAGSLGWVWRPYTNAGWRPYSNGHWVWTSYGWTWVSYEPFGWATDHYGYWACDNQLGWVWIPGYDWSACRVQWAYYDNYVSWAPLAPPGYYCPRPYTTAGINIWFTIGASHFCDPYPTRYCETPRYDSGYYAQRVKYKSPDRGYVQRYTGASVRTSTVTFKHKALSRTEMGTTTFRSNPKRIAATTSHGFKPEVRNGNTSKNIGRFENRAMKSRESKSVTRQFQPQEARRTQTTRQAVKPSRQTKSYRDAQQSRAIHADRPAKLAFNSARSPREQRVVSQPRHEQRAKVSFDSSRGSSTRKGAVASNQTQRRESTKVKGAGGAHGKGSGKGK